MRGTKLKKARLTCRWFFFSQPHYIQITLFLPRVRRPPCHADYSGVKNNPITIHVSSERVGAISPACQKIREFEYCCVFVSNSWVFSFCAENFFRPSCAFSCLKNKWRQRDSNPGLYPASNHRRQMWKGSNVFDRRWENHDLLRVVST